MAQKKRSREKGVIYDVVAEWRISSKSTGEHPWRSVISIKCNFIEITLRCGCSPVYLLQIFRTGFPKNNYGDLFLKKGLSDI